MERNYLINKAISRVTLVAFFAFPVEIIFFLIGFLTIGGIYLSLHELLGFDWTARSSVRVDARRFFEFWFTGLGIHIIHVLTYTIVALKAKIKIRFDLLGALVIVSTVFMATIDMRRPSGRGFVMADFTYHMVYAFLFAMIMFAAFTVITTLLDVCTKWKELVKVSLSFALSCLLGGAISHAVWIILFRIFHG